MKERMRLSVASVSVVSTRKAKRWLYMFHTADSKQVLCAQSTKVETCAKSNTI